LGEISSHEKSITIIGEAILSTFRLKNDRLLDVALENEKVMARAGAMVAYDESIKFEKALLGGEALLGDLKRTVTIRMLNAYSEQSEP